MEIFDMFDGLCPDDLPLDDSPIDTSRVLGLVRAEVKGEKRGPRRLGRAVRTALIAAALAALMGVTAYAAYEFFIDKYVIDQPAYYEPQAMKEDQATARISLTGYQGTPEYEAYTEWEAYENDWWEKAWEHDPWKERGVDDSWHETPDNYAGLYGASFQDQADALDAIVEKYGLTLHQDMAPYYQSNDLYEALGTEPFFGESVTNVDGDWDVSGYIYDDGSFKAEFDENLSGDRTVSMQMFVNAKGSFATISGVTELTEDCEAWQYTTKSGKSVDLYLAPNNAEIMTESEGAYISVSAHAGSAPCYDPAADPRLSEEEKRSYLEDSLRNDPDMTEAEQEAAWQELYDWKVEVQLSMLPTAITREDLQTIADSVDFAILADRFDGTAHPETADMLPVLKAREAERFTMPSADEISEQEAASQEVIARLDIFQLTPPAGYEDASLSGHRLEHKLEWEDVPAVAWMNQPAGDVVTRDYEGGNGNGTIGLSWYRFYADEDRTGSATAKALAEARKYLETLAEYGYSLSELEINSCEGFVFSDGSYQTEAMWYDAERDLMFVLGALDAGLDADDVAALAATVTVQPVPLSTPIPLP